MVNVAPGWVTAKILLTPLTKNGSRREDLAKFDKREKWTITINPESPCVAEYETQNRERIEQMKKDFLNGDKSDRVKVLSKDDCRLIFTAINNRFEPRPDSALISSLQNPPRATVRGGFFRPQNAGRAESGSGPGAPPISRPGPRRGDRNSSCAIASRMIRQPPGRSAAKIFRNTSAFSSRGK